jgi:single-stranded-DNA-specific exonuclease
MQRRLDQKDQSRLLMSFMKIVAIATIADAVPLLGENRVFASLGLKGLRSPVNAGLKALLEVAGLADGRSLVASDVGFRIGPRLNAAGRMDIASEVVELFSVKDIERAREIAGHLDKLNTERQDEERRILDDIEHKVSEDHSLRDAYCMVIEGDGWHRGVIGITATRVVEKYGRPALVLAREGEESHGSGRSIPAFHLLNALESCHELFSRYGGHAHAVGFSLAAANTPRLRERLDSYARAHLTPADFVPQLTFDAELSLENVTPVLQRNLRLLEPFGIGNPEPVFIARAARLMESPQAVKDKHVRLRLAPPAADAGPTGMDDYALTGNGGSAIAAVSAPAWRRAVTFKTMGWSMKESCDQLQLLPGDTLDIAYCLGMNDHPEYGGLELTLRDIKRAMR